MIGRLRVGGEGEGERAVLGFFLLVVVGIGGGEVDTRATLEGGKKGGDDGGADPAGHVAEIHERNDAVIRIVFFHHNSQIRLGIFNCRRFNYSRIEGMKRKEEGETQLLKKIQIGLLFRKEEEFRLSSLQIFFLPKT